MKLKHPSYFRVAILEILLSLYSLNDWRTHGHHVLTMVFAVAWALLALWDLADLQRSRAQRKVIPYTGSSRRGS